MITATDWNGALQGYGTLLAVLVAALALPVERWWHRRDVEALEAAQVVVHIDHDPEPASDSGADRELRIEIHSYSGAVMRDVVIKQWWIMGAARNVHPAHQDTAIDETGRGCTIRLDHIRPGEEGAWVQVGANRDPISLAPPAPGQTWVSWDDRWGKRWCCQPDQMPVRCSRRKHTA